MNPELIELCPICIENEALYFTECNHSYCITCLSRINKCAMCRKVLQRSLICVEIKRKIKRMQTNNSTRQTNNSTRQTNNSTRLLNFNHPVRELTWGINPEINTYHFSLRPQDHQPSGNVDFNRINSGEVRIYSANYNILHLCTFKTPIITKKN
jgi:hypothetical protein